MAQRPSDASIVVPPAARGCAPEWTRLASPEPPAGVFVPDAVSRLPEAAARWLRATITPGTPLASAVVLEMSGQIKVGAWRPFTAVQVIRPGTGFVWAATTRLAGLPLRGFDRYSSGSGQMRWRLLGAIPVMSADGPDIDRSAAGRLAAESVFVPTAYDRARWEPGPDADTAVATWHIDDHVESFQLRVAADGSLREIAMSRWGNPHGAPHGRHPFGVVIEDETSFAGVRVPSAVRAFWGSPGDDGDFFKARVSSVTPL